MDLEIRHAEPEDHESLWQTFSEEEVYAGTLQTPFPSRAAWRKRLSEPVPGDFVLVACMDGQIVGNASIHHYPNRPRRAHAMHIGIVVKTEFAGRGIGKALMQALVDLADKWLNVTRLELTVYADNERAIGLYKKFGFEVEGTHRGYALRNGQYVDAIYMARLRPKTLPSSSQTASAEETR